MIVGQGHMLRARSRSKIIEIAVSHTSRCTL